MTMTHQDAKQNEKRDLSPQHKEALAQGRTEGAIVRRYLKELDARQPRRGRKPNREKLVERLNQVKALLPNAGADRLALIAERNELESRIERLGEDTEMDPQVEEDFVRVVADYSARKGYTFGMLREAGVPAEVLNRAGLYAQRGRGARGASESHDDQHQAA